MNNTYDLCLIVLNKRIERKTLTEEYANKLLLDFETFKLADRLTADQYESLVSIIKAYQDSNSTKTTTE